MRVTIVDEAGGKASLSLQDDKACQVFKIDYAAIDVFKEYFF